MITNINRVHHSYMHYALQKLCSREEPRTSETFHYDALDIDVLAFGRTPEFEEDVTSGSTPFELVSSVYMAESRTMMSNSHFRLKGNADATLLLLNEEPCVRR